MDARRKRRLLLWMMTLCTVCYAAVFFRTWMVERSKGAYFMTPVWAAVLVLWILITVIRIRRKN